MKRGPATRVRTSINLLALEISQKEDGHIRAEGLTNKEMADRLDQSPLTVRNYLERVYLKMDVQRRSAAAVLFSRAVEGGLIPTDEKTTK